MAGSLRNNQAFLIAVVDDDPSVREALESSLRSLGFRAATFSSAHDFLAFPQLPSVSCVILDIYMPGMNGIELHRHLITMRPIPVIFVTAHSDSMVEQQVTRAGAICLLRKPFSDDALIDCLNSALSI